MLKQVQHDKAFFDVQRDVTFFERAFIFTTEFHHNRDVTMN